MDTDVSERAYSIVEFVTSPLWGKQDATAAEVQLALNNERAAGMAAAVERLEGLAEMWRSVADARSPGAANALRLAAGQLSAALEEMKR